MELQAQQHTSGPPSRPRFAWAFVLLCLLLASGLSGEEAKPEKPKLGADVEKAFAAFIAASTEARKNVATSELTRLCDEVDKSVQLNDDQRKRLEAEAQPAIADSCSKFADKLDAWLRPFLVGYGDRGLGNLGRWKPEQFASRPNVAASPQDSTAWEAAIKRVLTPEQMVVYQRELGDRTARRKREIATYLKDALALRRNQLVDALKLEREGIVRELNLDRERITKLEAAEKSAVESILAEDEKRAGEQLLALNEESWRQMYGSGGMYQFESTGGNSQISKREAWTSALGSVLVPEELKRWEGTLARRQERRERAAAMGAVAELEDKVLLNSEQRPKLEKVFLERWRRYPSNDNNQIYPMNLLRSGSDAEVRNLLDKDQQKRWDEFVRGGYGSGRNAGAPPAKPTPPGSSPQPVDAELVFAAHFLKLYHEQRDRMMSAMQERVDELARVASLPEAAVKLVQVAARGAVERALDAGWKTNIERNVRGSVEGVAPQFLKQRLDSMGESRYNTQPPEDNPLWLETLRTALTDPQREAYEAVLNERSDYLNRAIVQIVLAQLESTLRISGEQGDRLEPLLMQVVRDYWPDYQRSFSGSNYAIYPYYLPVLLAGVPSQDRSAILTPEQVKQFDGDAQSRYNGWWENMKRQHDQRTKGRIRGTPKY